MACGPFRMAGSEDTGAATNESRTRMLEFFGEEYGEPFV